MNTIILFDPDRLPARDALGHVQHPDLPEYANGELLAPKLAALGFHGHVTLMTASESEDYEARGDKSLAWWVPDRPSDGAWSLALIDGGGTFTPSPRALWVRPLVGRRVAWDRHDEGATNLLRRAGVNVTAAEVATWPDRRVRDAEGWAAAVVMRREQEAFIEAVPRPHWLTGAEGATASMTDAARDVLAERQRQISAEGWTPEHDGEHFDGAIARAAASYAMSSAGYRALGLEVWPWEADWFKPTDARRDLVKAGALILAEIERIDRAAISPPAPEQPAPDPVHGDVLPAIGSTVYILHGRDSDAHECRVVGHYAWPSLSGDRFSHRVFVRLVYAGTDTQQARHISGVWPTAEAALASRQQPADLSGQAATAAEGGWISVDRRTLEDWKGRINTLAALSLKSERKTTAIRLKQEIADMLAPAPTSPTEPAAEGDVA